MNKQLKNMLLLLFISYLAMNTVYAWDENTELITPQEMTQQEAPIAEDTTYTVDITSDNYHEYFTGDNELNDSKLQNNTQLKLHSIPKDTHELGIYTDNENMNLSITGVNNLTLNNTAVIISSKIKNFKLSNISFNYDESYEEEGFIFIETLNTDTDSYLLENIHINCIQNKPYYTHDIHPLDINAKNVYMNNITIDARLPSNTISYMGQDNKPHSIALNIRGEKITLNNGNIKLVEHDRDIYSTYNTIYALYNEADYFTMTNTSVNISGEEYVYAVVSRSSYNNITYNRIICNSTVYSAGINIEGTNIRNNNISHNFINITAGYRQQGTTPNGAEDSAYGVLLLDYSYKGGKYTPNANSIDNNTYTYNTITGSAGNIYAIEVFGGTNTNLSNNNINLTGRTPMGIGAIGENVTINNNQITSEGDTNNTEASADYLKPRTVGVYTYLSSTGIQIDNNTIDTRRGRGIYIEQSNNTMITNNQVHTTKHDYAVEITGQNNTVEHNFLLSRNHEADNAVRTTANNTIKDNTNTPLKTRTIITLPEIHANPGEEINITANITDTYNNPIKSGLVTFTDAYEDIHLEAPVTNGKATVIIVFDEPINTILIATYTPTDEKIESSQTENILTIIDEHETTLTINTNNNQDTLELQATLTNSIGENINGGKVTFKVNGKTVKDANGKVIYAKVVDGKATVQYTVPDNMNGKNINITATYSGTSKYNKATTSITTRVEKRTPTLETENVSGSAGTTIQLKATITDNNIVINTGKIVFKINGKTVKDENGKVIYAKVINNQAIVNYTLPADMKSKDYNITATFISSDYERLEDTKVISVTA